MKIYTLQLGSLGANCYIIETQPGQCVAIDVGGDADRFLNFLNSKKLRLSKIFLTHGHFDHIGGVAETSAKTGAEVYIHENDSVMLENKSASLAAMAFAEYTPVKNYISISGDSYITDGNLTFRVLHTPGHSMGSVCYICENNIFSGDTLFCGSIGRTDFPGSNVSMMRQSLKTLKELPGNYSVYPGHNESTDLNYERNNNPYLRTS